MRLSGNALAAPSKEGARREVPKTRSRLRASGCTCFTDKESRVPFPLRRPVRSKLKNVACEYGGERYPSKKEARYAASLDTRLAMGEFREWKRGKLIPLVSNGMQLLTPKGRALSYKPDFVLTHHNESRELVEVKGRRAGVQYSLYWLKREVLRSMGLSVTEV